MLNFFKYLIILPVRFYQKCISPFTPPSCCYHPTCSQYMIDSVQEWGVIRGVWLGLKRLFRCHPWSEGGCDPVPKKVKLKNK